MYVNEFFCALYCKKKQQRHDLHHKTSFAIKDRRIGGMLESKIRFLGNVFHDSTSLSYLTVFHDSTSLSQLTVFYDSQDSASLSQLTVFHDSASFEQGPYNIRINRAWRAGSLFPPILPDRQIETENISVWSSDFNRFVAVEMNKFSKSKI